MNIPTLSVILLFASLTQWVNAFLAPIIVSPNAARLKPSSVITTSNLPAKQSGDDDNIIDKDTESTSKATLTPPSYATSDIEPHLAFPVISKIAGMEWTGDCRYINKELTPMTNLKLSGGVKYDINNGTTLTLSSFLTFPNGQTREVVMQGTREVLPPNKHEVMILKPSAGEEGGPIDMHLSEICPDTILINEVMRDSGKIIMTSSINIVQGPSGLELVGVSHEVGDGGEGVIEGHQIWRMKSSSTIEFNDFNFRSATGW